MNTKIFQLVMRAGSGSEKTFTLSKNEIFIGRDINNDIVINDPGVNRRHARLNLQPVGFMIEDLGSTRGTYVNGKRLMAPHLLHPGERIILGENILLSYEMLASEINADTSSPEKLIKQHKIVVFLCHASGDKPKVRDLYHKLSNNNVTPWLDEEDLLPGQDWQFEIPKALRMSDAVIVCLSEKAITKAGYVQKEIRYALDFADEQPEGTIYLIPLRLEKCDVPERLRRWHWVDFFEQSGFERLIRALKKRAKDLGLAEPTYSLG